MNSKKSKSKERKMQNELSARYAMSSARLSGSSMTSINVDLRGEIEVKRLFLTVVVAAMIFCM